jgi:hypothetical protein
LQVTGLKVGVHGMGIGGGKEENLEKSKMRKKMEEKSKPAPQESEGWAHEIVSGFTSGPPTPEEHAQRKGAAL